MDSGDVTLQVLIQIRDKLNSLEEQAKAMTAELAQTRHDLGRRIDQTNRQLRTTETRLATEIGALRSVVAEPERAASGLEERVHRCEREIAELRDELRRGV